MPLYVHEWDFFNAPVEKSHEVILIEDHAKVIAAKDAEIKKLHEQVLLLTENVREPVSQHIPGEQHSADGEWRGACSCTASLPAGEGDSK